MKRERQQAASVDANEKAFASRDNVYREARPVLVMHDDNTAMIQVFRTGKNPTMRQLGGAPNGCPPTPHGGGHMGVLHPQARARAASGEGEGEGYGQG